MTKRASIIRVISARIRLHFHDRRLYFGSKRACGTLGRLKFEENRRWPVLGSLNDWIAGGLGFFVDLGGVLWGLWDYVVSGVEG